MKLKEGFIVRRIAGQYLAVPTGGSNSMLVGSVVLNKISVFILEKMKCTITKEALLDSLTDAYEVDRDTASADLEEVLKAFEEYGMIEQ